MLSSGVARMMLALFCFSLVGALVKGYNAHLPFYELVFIRCLWSLPVLVILARRRGLSLWPNNPPLVLFRALTGIGAMASWFYGVGELPLADALLLSRLQPVLVAIAAPFVLNESTPRAAAFAILISLVGVALILQPSLQIGNLAGFALLASAVLGSAAHLSLRRLSADDDPTVIVLALMAVGAVIAAPFTVARGVWPAASDLPGLVSLAGLATLGQIVMTYAYRVEKAPPVAAASYVGVPLSVLWGWIIWAEIPTPLVWTGGSLVVGAGMFLLWSRRKVGPRRFRAMPKAEASAASVLGPKR